jgi:hypothetical protein
MSRQKTKHQTDLSRRVNGTARRFADRNHSTPVWRYCLGCGFREIEEFQPVSVDMDRNLTVYRCTNCNRRITLSHEELACILDG